MASKLLPPVVQLSLLLIIGRNGGLTDVGLVALASSVSFLCGSLAEAGFGISLSVPATYLDTERPPLRATREARIGAALMGSVLYLLLWCVGVGSHQVGLLILVPLPFLLALSYGYAGAMNHSAVLRYEATVSFAESMTVVVLALALIQVMDPVYAVLTGLLVGRLAGTIARAVLLRHIPTSAAWVPHVVRTQLPFVATTGAIVAQGQADILLLGFMGSLAMLGVYAPLLRMAYGALLVAEAFGWALYPTRPEEVDSSASGVGARVVRHWRLSGLVLGVIAGAAFLVLAKPVLQVIVNQPVHGVGLPIALLSLVIVVRFGSFVLSVDIVRQGLQMARLPYLLGGAVVLLVGTALSRGRSLDVLTGSRLASEVFLAAGYAFIVASLRRPQAESLTLPARLPRAHAPLSGLRCPRCLAPLDAAECSCGLQLTPTPYARVVAEGAPAATFTQPVDERILTDIVPGLQLLTAPISTEAILERFGRDEGYEFGNPVWVGRMDIGRLLPQADGIVLDLGCGFGTNTVAMARSATHVFALDRSISRAALTGARARAEALENVTVIHADAEILPLGNDTCDLVLVVGVLEWVGLDADDPRRKQLGVLSEVARVLKPGGRLLLGIENRWGAHYFAGAREEHTGLRFSSILPRRIADVYSRRVRGRPVTTLTYSRRSLKRLLRECGLDARFCFPLPSYSCPQFSFDESEIAAGKRFYLRHVFHYSSVRRRLAARALAFMPDAVVGTTLPSLWAVAGFAKPDRLPAAVTGRQYGFADVKALSLEQGKVARFARRTGTLRSVEPLLDGWNARRWVTQPLPRRVRDKRLAWVINRAADLIHERKFTNADSTDRDTAVAEARAGLRKIVQRLDPETQAWCARCIASVSDLPLVAAVEHRDLLLTNLIVCDATLTPIDVAQERREVVGTDATSLLLDALALLGGAREFRLDSAFRAGRAMSDNVAAACCRLLKNGLGPVVDADPVGAVVFALLRRDNAHQLTGLEAFLVGARRGELAELLTRIGSGTSGAPAASIQLPEPSLVIQ